MSSEANQIKFQPGTVCATRSYDEILRDFEDRFIPEPNSGCWLWTGARGPRGYGSYSAKGKAHRVAWELYRGAIPLGLCVCHKCDTRACVNPDHLFLGTHKENIQDMFRKGREHCRKGRNLGEANGIAKLTEDKVLSILEHLVCGLSQREVARRFEVSQKTICDIANDKLWKHISR